MQLAWSGSWAIRVNPRGNWERFGKPREETITIQVGPAIAAPMRIISPGETIRTPSVHIGTVAGDLDQMVQELHRHQRRSVFPEPPKGRAQLVTYNHWSHMSHEMNETALKEQIDIAVDIGADVFTIDAGWWGEPGEAWTTKLGTWRPGGRLPNGFGPVFDYARSRGLMCGLWCWIEAATADTELISEHPDWLIRRDGKPVSSNLDLAKPVVAEWVESQIVRIIEDYGLDLFRLDYNAYPGEGGTNPRDGFDENSIFRHYEAMYGIWERVRERFPNLVLENCAGGGARTDLGMLSRFHCTWISDYTLAPRTIRIQNGMTMALAPEVIARLAGSAMNAHTMGDLDLQLRMNILHGYPCISGLWPNSEQPNHDARRQVIHALDLFRREIRPLLPTCKVYHHTPVLPGEEPTGHCVIEYASTDGRKAVVAVFRLIGDREDEYRLHPRGLRRDLTYAVYFDNRRETVTMAGTGLIDNGLRIPLTGALTSELLVIKEMPGA